MKLSAEQFAELAATFNAKESPIEHDRRRAARMDLRANVKITPVHAGRRLSPTHVMVSDFSARGIAFIQSDSMIKGEQFVTELPRNGGGNVELLCTVMHCRSIGHNVFTIGAEFTCVLPPGVKHIPEDDKREMNRIRKTLLS